MSPIDWTLVVVLNGSIILYAIWRGRGTETSSEWFLAGRTLPWWIVGLSMYATAIDSSDMAVDSGGVYNLGVSYFVTGWVGTVFGWVLLAYFVGRPMYRAGMYTNAEYLEARFTTSTRIISALVQVQYRTLVLAIISVTIYYILRVVCGWDPTACWIGVITIALLATYYTMVGGLKSVAVTDAMQSVVMFAAGLILFFIVLGEVGGWSGITEKIDAHTPGMSDRLMHIGHDRIEEKKVSDAEVWTDEKIENQLLLGGEHDPEKKLITRSTPAVAVCIWFVISGMAYSIVNHTQSMRLFGARSEWDMKMAVVVASLCLIFATFFNLSMGVMGRALHPDLSVLPVAEDLQGRVDVVYPVLISTLTSVGFQGLIVAGVFAACFSTYDSIGSTISALVTRDVYARLFVPDGSDAHYLKVGRWLTPAIIFGSFVYVPFLLGDDGMLLYYLDLVGTFVVPLLMIYLMGIFTRVHRSSGTIGMLAGVVYGLWRMLAVYLAEDHGVLIIWPPMANVAYSYPIGMVVTGGTMVLVSLFRGWETSGTLMHEEATGWLKNSQQQIQSEKAVTTERNGALPAVLCITVLAIGIVLSFVVFW